ncbi:major facilitator superfamily domain-containing protein 10-like [Paramacrobiotus metropolitanus]|uniref:major facilitator superfamily domain-containing protein 10-like n=1 Tax=Paramacrobiotus metropolitanus TaxID=2943436 RepID=UPI0024463E12|nr:major facilitator superfamily domain-containing protein 10-like [Paramacrobiotus metropolitanus]
MDAGGSLRERGRRDGSSKSDDHSNPRAEAKDIKDGDAADGHCRKIYGIIFVILLIDLLAFTSILPLMPALLDFYGKDGQDVTYNVIQQCIAKLQTFLGIADLQKFSSVLYGGILGSLFSLLQFLASPLVGALSDVYGRKPLLLLTTSGIAVSYLIWALSSSFTMFIVARIVMGLSKGNIGLGTAVVTDVSTVQTRGKGMALVGVAFSVGFIVGPMIGALFSSYAQRNNLSLFYIYAALFALVLEVADLLVVWFALPETLPKHKRAKSLIHNLKEAVYLIDPRHLFNFTAVKDLSNADRVWIRKIGLTNFLFLFFFSGLEFTLTFLTHTRFNYTSMQQGRLFLFVGIIMILVQGGFVRRLKPGSEKRTALMGLALVVPAFVIIGIANSQGVMYFGLCLYSFGSSTVVPCLMTMISKYGRDDQKGTIMGIFRSLGAFARATGVLPASVLYWILGPTFTYCIGGLMLLLPFCVLK